MYPIRLSHQLCEWIHKTVFTGLKRFGFADEELILNLGRVTIPDPPNISEPLDTLQGREVSFFFKIH